MGMDSTMTSQPAAIVPEIAIAKSAGDAVANGDDFDVTFTLVVENTGSVNLDSLTLFDDLAAEFGNALVGVSGLSVQNFAGSGTAPTANAAWESDTSLSLLNDDGFLNPGDRFEVVFTTTIDPDGIDNVSQPLENQATVGGNAVDDMGNPLTNSAGDPLVASDDSDSGASPQGTNPGENGDLGTGDDPTPIIIADISAAKQVVGAPTQLANGNFAATYQVVVENTGNVDLANLTLSEDLATQLGAAFENASGLRLTTPPSDASSSVTLDRVNWDGETFTEIVDISQPSSLAVGDSFVFEFTVEIDAAGVSGSLENTVTAGGDAVDADGVPINDSMGAPITTTDDSDSGTDPSGTNPDEQGDMGTSDDPTPLLIPSIGLAKVAGEAVPNGENFDVTFTLNWENTGNVALNGVEILDDIMDQFGGQFAGATIDSVTTSGTATVVANPAWGTADTAPSLISHTGDPLAVGDTIQVVFTVTIDPDASGTATGGLENQATSNGTGINPDTGVADPTLTATDSSDDGTDPTTENGSEDTADGVFANDPTTLAPIAVDDRYTGNEDTPVALDPLSNDFPGGGVDTVEILNIPDATIEGTLTYVDDLTGSTITVSPSTVLSADEAASLMFNPVPDFNGPVTTIGYEVTDVNGDTTQAVIDITITPTPDAVDDPFTTNEDTPVNVSPLGNDDDGEGVDSVTVNTIPDPAEGILTYLDAGGNPVTVTPGTVLTEVQAATLEFTPADDFNGPITPIEYTLTDINGATSDAQITVDVIPTPDAVDDSFVTNEDTSVLLDPLANDDLGAGVDSMTINNIPDPAVEGILTYLDATGNPVTVMAGDVLTPDQAATLTFVPVMDFNGTVPPISYTVADINGATSDAEINITVVPTPDAVDDVNATSADTPVSGNVIDNDLSFVGENLMVSEVNGIAIGNGPITTEFGTVDIAPNGTYTFTPRPGLDEPASFTYTVVDENGEESEATVVIDIADLGIAKAIVGTPTFLSNGNYSVTYRVVVENIGTLGIGSLSLVENLASQFGSGLVSASDLKIVAPTSDLDSSIALDSNWNGDSITEMLAAGARLESGDSFTLEFKVEVNPAEFSSEVENSVVGTGNAIDGDGNIVSNANGDTVTVSDLSDSGTNPSNSNLGQPGDTFGSDDPTPLYIPSIGLAKSAGDAAPNGDNFDVTFTLAFENNGSVDLTNLTLFDNVRAQFGDAFVSVSGVSVDNFVGTGEAPNANAAWVNNTATSLIEGGTANIGDSFEVVFTVTVDANASTGTLANQATANGEALDQNGDPLRDASGNLVVAVDVSDNGVDPNTENSGDENFDGVLGNDPTPLVIADLGIAKSIVGEPVLVAPANYVVTYQLVVENTGTVDLGSLTLTEDIFSQFGSAFVEAGNLRLIDGPSGITLDSVGFDGNGSPELLLGSDNTLAVGETFTVQYDVEIDPAQATDPLENQVIGEGVAVDANGSPLLASDNSPITAFDQSDSGVESGTANPESADDQGTSDDPTVFDPPAIPLSAIIGTVFQDSNSDGVRQAGEAGIEDIEITLTGTDVFGNAVELTVFTDANGRYSFQDLNAGEYTVTQTQPEGFNDGIDVEADGSTTPINDVSRSISLGFGETFNSTTFAERLPGTSGNPPNLPGLGQIFNSPVSNLLRSVAGRPGPIYSGIPINANADPLSLDSGRAVSGGYAVDRTAGNCGCPEPINPCSEPADPRGETLNWSEEMIEQPVDFDACEGEVIETGLSEQTEGEVVPENVEVTDLEQIERVDQAEIPSPLLTEATLGKTSFLKRMSNWMSL